MVTEIEIQKIIIEAKRQIGMMKTSDFSNGKLHRYLSKAFVAGIGNLIKSKYNGIDYETRFQDFEDGKGKSGEWLFDAVVVKIQHIGENERKLKYAYKIEVAIESELAPGGKAFMDDFSKLLIANSSHKIYINGVKASKKKEEYISERMALIKYILKENPDNSKYTICFVDHPSLWKNENVFVKQISL